MKKNVIAIDGPAASGKSTIANLLAEKLQIPYINTGNMYRAVTWFFQQENVDIDSLSSEDAQELLSRMKLDYVKNSDGLFDLELNGQFPARLIRTPEVASKVSIVAALPSVRAWLTEKQRAMADIGLILMEGRDIGTVVFPDAKYKFFLTASPMVRAKRRLGQEGETFDGATVESVAKEIEERDKLDMNRSIAPLRQAEDGILVDSSDLTIDGVLDFVISRIKND